MIKYFVYTLLMLMCLNTGRLFAQSTINPPRPPTYSTKEFFQQRDSVTDPKHINSPFVAHNSKTGDSVVSVEVTDNSLVKELQPSAVYDLWWKQITKCLNKPLSISYLRKLTWYSVSAPFFFVQGRGPYDAYTFAWDREIYIVDNDVFLEMYVKHEMTHYILWNYGITDSHPAKYFRDSGCGNEPNPSQDK